MLPHAALHVAPNCVLRHSGLETTEGLGLMAYFVFTCFREGKIPAGSNRAMLICSLVWKPSECGFCWSQLETSWLMFRPSKTATNLYPEKGNLHAVPGEPRNRNYKQRQTIWQ